MFLLVHESVYCSFSPAVGTFLIFHLYHFIGYAMVLNYLNWHFLSDLSRWTLLVSVSLICILWKYPGLLLVFVFQVVEFFIFLKWVLSVTCIKMSFCNLCFLVLETKAIGQSVSFLTLYSVSYIFVFSGSVKMFCVPF